MTTRSIAIIGYGGMGAHHAHLIKEGGLFGISGVYDIDPARMSAAQADGLKAFPGWKQAVESPDTDVVLIATPNDSHLFYVEQAARAGKHIICEKPVAMSAAEAELMQAEVQRAGVVFMVHQNRRWDEDFLTVKNIISGGEIGSVLRIESRVMGANGIPGGWRKLPAHGGGMMLDWGVHLIDQLLLLDSSGPARLHCRYSYDQGFEVDDAFWLDMEFKSGMSAHICVHTNCFTPLPRWLVLGDSGSAVIENWELHGEMIVPVYDDEAHKTGMRAGNGFTKTMAYRSHSSVRRLELPRAKPDRQAFYHHFSDVISGGVKPSITFEQVIGVMRFMELCAQSANEKRVIEF